MNTKTIFWDMDGTLGFFEKIGYRMQGEEVPDYITESFGLNEGIEDLLKELESRGFNQYITTSATQDYTTEVLKETGIGQYFRKVFTREDISGVYGGPKRYHVVLDELNISIYKSKSDVLIIGNSTTDVPYSKTKDIVSIIDNYYTLHNSKLTKKIIDLLIEHGKGDFNKGFHELYNNSEKIEPYAKHLSLIGKMIIGKDAEIHLKFMEERENDCRAPIVWIQKANNYFSKKTLEKRKKW